MCFQALFHVLEGLHRIDAKRDVVDPHRRVGRGQCRLVIAQVEKRDERSVLQAEKEVRVRAVLARAGHHVALDDVIERQAQDVFVEMPRLLGIPGALGVVVQLLDGRGRGQRSNVFQNGGHISLQSL